MKTLVCSKCAVTVPDLPPQKGFVCPYCGTDLIIVRSMSKRERVSYKLNINHQLSKMKTSIN